MKTYIVQLENHDDVISARDKIAWSKARRILLVWPRRGRVLERRVDLLLLQRHSRQIGAQLAIVTGSGEVKANAREIGIPVFPSAAEAQQVNWRRPRKSRKPPWMQRKLAEPSTLRERREGLREQGSSKSWVRLLTFLVGLTAFLALVLFFAPGAEVRVKPQRIAQQLTLAVWANPEIQAPNPSGGLPAQVVKVVVEGRDQSISTGQGRIPDRPATGQVVLKNLTDQTVSVPAGSVVRTLSSTPQLFTITNAVEVPAGPGKTASAAVQAAAPGSAGNVSAGQISAMEGPVGLRLSVENIDPTRGGADRASPAPSKADAQSLREKLLANLQGTANEEIQAGLKPGQRLLDGTLRLHEVVQERQEPAEGQPGDRLQLTMRVEFEAWTVSEQDLQVVAQAALEANREKAYQPVPESLKFDFVTQPALDTPSGTASPSARWDLSVSRTLEARWSRTAAVRAVQGRSLDEARQILQSNLLLAQAPVIHLTPAWWFRMPFLPFRIGIVQEGD